MYKSSLAATLLLTAVTLSAESFTYQTIAAPGAMSTNPVGIDDQGQIVGNYTNSLGTYGFIDTGGTFTTLAGVTVINTSSNGTLLVSTANGFATYFNGKYSPITIPGYPYLPPPYFQPFPVTPTAIDNSGQIVGNAELEAWEAQFLVNGNQLTLLSLVDGEHQIQANGLNNQAVIVGTQVVVDHGQPFGGGALPSFGAIYNSAAGNWTLVQAADSLDTNFSAINNSDQIVGSAAPYAYPPYDQAVLYSGGVFTYLAVPNTPESAATGINDLGEIVGNTLNQGFLAIPETNTAVPEPITGAMGILGLAVIWVSKEHLRSGH